LEDIHL